MANPKYKRILIKLSGEALAGERGVGIDIQTVQTIAKEIDVYKRQSQISLTALSVFWSKTSSITPISFQVSLEAWKWRSFWLRASFVRIK